MNAGMPRMSHSWGTTWRIVMAKLHNKISPFVTIIALFFSYQDYKKTVGTCTLDFIAFSVQ